MSDIQNPVTLAEVFHVNASALPKLTGYRLNITAHDHSAVGGKLSYRLRRRFGGHWIWTSGIIVTDSPRGAGEIGSVVESAWKEQPEPFKYLLGVEQMNTWTPNSQVKADFVARGLFSDIEREIEDLLRLKKQDLRTAWIERVHESRGWVIQGQPAVSISVSSRLVHKQDLKEFWLSTVDKDLTGLWVAEKRSTLKGEIVGLAGRVVDHRKRLLALSERPEMIELIKNAEESDPVVTVLSGRSLYDYVASALRVVVRVQDFGRFKVDRQRALRGLRIEPESRFDMINTIGGLARKHGWIGDHYDSSRSLSDFLYNLDYAELHKLRLGSGAICSYDPKTVLGNLRRFGLYRRNVRFPAGSSVGIGVLNALVGEKLDSFEAGLLKELKMLDFQAEFIAESEPGSTTRADLEMALNRLMKKDIDIIVAFLPDESDDDEDQQAYDNLKSIAVGRGIPSQVVNQSTLENRYALANIALGVLGKTGNVPFVLAEPLEYTDYVVGIDIARMRKERLPGSINATAIARIYFGNGEFLRYVIHDAPLEGETIPERVLQGLFPIEDFKGKKAVVHRDGYFRGDEKKALSEWASKIGAQFHLVEVIKTGCPRLYGKGRGRVIQPLKGVALKLSESEAFLVSSLPPFVDATPIPLRLRCSDSFPISQAIDSVLALTTLHYGSLRPPKLPVTIHYSDKIGYLALKGIKPRELTGAVPYWL